MIALTFESWIFHHKAMGQGKALLDLEFDEYFARSIKGYSMSCDGPHSIVLRGGPDTYSLDDAIAIARKQFVADISACYKEQQNV